MLNIISRSILFKGVSGPKKVVENLIKGLDKLGYPYVINKRLDACKRLWIHDDAIALKKINSLPPEIKVIIGPNIHALPNDISKNIDISKAVYLLPADWVKNFWIELGFNRCLIDIWPVGIDTDEFKPSNRNKEFVLIYFKIRDKLSEEKILKRELKQIEDILKNKNLNYRIAIYGSYKEKDYQNLLSGAKYIVWLGMLETQGLALEEALAANTPILVCDFISHFTCVSSRQDRYYKVTNAPYFSNECGIKIKNLSKLEQAIDYMEQNFSKFQPRKYILENLNLEKQAKEFVKLFERNFDLTYEMGFQEKLFKNGNWLNNELYYIFWLKLKSFIKFILVKTGIWELIMIKKWGL